MYTRILAGVSWFFLIGVSPLMAQNVESAWKDVVKSCNKSKIVGKQVLFFGPSNTVGLGSVWRKGTSGGYNLRFELSDLVKEEPIRQQIIKLGEKTTDCKDSKGSKWNINLGLPFIGPILGQTGVEADFRRARQVTVTADQVALDIVKEVPFEQAIRTLATKNPNDPYLKDLLESPDRQIVTKAYRLTGLRVTLDYDPKQLEELKGKYPEGGSLKIGGDKGINIGFNYSGTSNLTVTLPKEVYIAGEFSRIAGGRLGLTGEPSQISIRLQSVRVDPNAPIRVEPLQAGAK